MSGTSLDIQKRKGYNRWSVRFRIPPNHKKNYWHWSKSIIVEGNKNEAYAAGVKYRKQYYAKPNDNIDTLEQYIYNYENSRYNIKQSSIDRDKTIILRINDYLGQYKLSELNTALIENFYNYLRSKGDSPSTLHKVHTKLKAILKKATDEGRIYKNPCNLIKGITRPKAQNQNQLYTDEQFTILKKEIKKRPITGNMCVLKIALSTGMRKGEILGLLWENVDLDNKYITIKYQLDKNKQLTSPKTESSIRKIPINTSLFDYLVEWKNTQEKYFESKNVVITQKSPVCTNEVGDFINGDNFGRWRRKFYYDIGIATYKNIVKTKDSSGKTRIHYEGYKGPSLHALRKKYAEILVSQDIDPKTVQALLGHEKITTTLEIYAQAVPRNSEKAINKINKYLK